MIFKNICQVKKKKNTSNNSFMRCEIDANGKENQKKFMTIYCKVVRGY